MYREEPIKGRKGWQETNIETECQEEGAAHYQNGKKTQIAEESEKEAKGTWSHHRHPLHRL